MEWILFERLLLFHAQCETKPCVEKTLHWRFHCVRNLYCKKLPRYRSPQPCIYSRTRPHSSLGAPISSSRDHLTLTLEMNCPRGSTGHVRWGLMEEVHGDKKGATNDSQSRKSMLWLQSWKATKLILGPPGQRSAQVVLEFFSKGFCTYNWVFIRLFVSAEVGYGVYVNSEGCWVESWLGVFTAPAFNLV